MSAKFSEVKPSSTYINDDIQKVVRIVLNLAKKRIGAILVFVGNTPVTNIITGGKLLSSELDSDLVESIFDSRTPSHDGAMLIENDNIVKIACQLPLSKGVKASLNLGTRHSAALGIAERSDSFTIVISEEKGSISIAENNDLVYDISRSYLESCLLLHLLIHGFRKRFLHALVDSFAPFGPVYS